jgi:5-methyltetrahydrofolate--homocysteine methyltransferase
MGTIAPLPLFDLHSRRRRLPLLRAMTERVLVCDGAMGTMIQNATTSPPRTSAARRAATSCSCATRPDVIRQIHAAYFEAGADCVETNTFGGTRLVLNEFDLGDAPTAQPPAAALAREVADRVQHPRAPALRARLGRPDHPPRQPRPHQLRRAAPQL